VSREHVQRPHLLLVEEDERLTQYLFGLLTGLGYVVNVARTFQEALETARARPPAQALVDARPPGGSGIALVRALKEMHPTTRVVFCTAYPSIANTVEVMRLGADDYLSKPITPEQLATTFGRASSNDGGSHPPPSEGRILSLARARWEYINRVLAECNGNVAAAARRLGIHRQSLQRMLRKHPPV
jgi:two-component system response regulator RegA